MAGPPEGGSGPAHLEAKKTGRIRAWRVLLVISRSTFFPVLSAVEGEREDPSEFQKYSPEDKMRMKWEEESKWHENTDVTRGRLT